MNEVQAKKDSVIITKHGERVAKLVLMGEQPDEIYGVLADKGSITGDTGGHLTMRVSTVTV